MDKYNTIQYILTYHSGRSSLLLAIIPKTLGCFGHFWWS